MEKLIIDNICKSFDSLAVLRDFSMDVEPGGRVSIMGPSGCGKTTLLRLIMGLETPDSGSISGVPERVSAVFQEDRLCPDFGAVSNLRLVTGRRYTRSELEKELRAVGITDDLYKPVREFSGGMRRRVALVRALLAQSELVLLDEPFKGLDGDTRDLTIEYVLGRIGDRTLIHVTHSQEDAQALNSRVIRMHNQ